MAEDDNERRNDYASPPCFMHELQPGDRRARLRCHRNGATSRAGARPSANG